MKNNKLVGFIFVIVIIISLLFIFSPFKTGNLTKSSTTPTPKRNISLNPENLFIEINNYRTENGVGKLTRDSDLCFRIGAFWDELQGFRNSRKNPNSNESSVIQKMLIDFVDLNKKNGAYKNIIKQDGVWGGGENVVDTVQTWKELPYTSNTLLNKDFNIGCAFAKDGTSIVLVGEKK